jgi:hypothetical protein
MKVSKISIKNILGQQELEFIPKDTGITVISGPNRAGKTSVLEAIKSVVNGGHDATLIRHGAEEGEVVLVLDDGTEVRKRIRPAGSTLVGRTDKGSISGCKSWLDRIVNREVFDLVGFLRAESSDRIEMLIRAIPVELPSEKIKLQCEAAGESFAELLRDKNTHPLEKLDKLERRLYEIRTGVNRSAKDKRATAGELSRAILDGLEAPEVLEIRVKDVERRVTETRANTAKLRIDLAEENRGKLKEIQLKQDCDRGTACTKRDDRVTAAERQTNERTMELDAQIAVLQKAKEDLLADLNVVKLAAHQECSAAMDLIAEEQRRQEYSLAEEFRLKGTEIDVKEGTLLAGLKTEAATLLEKRDASNRAKTTREIVERTEAEATDLEAESKRLTASLEHLGEVRMDLAKSLPIPGLTIVEGEICLNRVPYGHLSGAERVTLAFEIARRVSGDLKLILCDGIEQLDEESFTRLEQLASESGIQAIVTRVTTGETMKVE